MEGELFFSDLLVLFDWEAYAHQATWLTVSAVILGAISNLAHIRAMCGDGSLGFNRMFQNFQLGAATLWFAVWTIEILVLRNASLHGVDVFACRRGLRSAIDLLSGFVVPLAFLGWAIWMLWLAHKIIRQDKVNLSKLYGFK